MKLDKRRRLEHKTDYKKRMRLLEGKFPRLVIRKTNRYLILQIVESKNAQDRVICSTTTKELLNFGWPKERIGSLKCLGACYLAGFLIGKKYKDKSKELILDSGLHRSSKGSRIYACVKGVIDSGLNIKCSKNILPTEERIMSSSKKINSELIQKIKKTIESKI